MKKILLSLVLALVALFALSSVALAADPTETNVTWDGAGTVVVGVDSVDSNSGVATGGSAILGTYTVVDSNNNPYNYGVDSFSAYLNAGVTNGYVSTGTNRVESYASMYGAGGQTSWSNVYVEGGTASMAYRSTTNYAQMVDATYTYQLAGGHNIVVNADYFEMSRGVADGRGNQGYISSYGTGSATLDCMSAEASGAWDLKLGRGAGCYTDANYNATGDGYFEATGIGNTFVTFNGLGISAGGGSLSVIANYLNSFGIGDYSLTAR